MVRIAPPHLLAWLAARPKNAPLPKSVGGRLAGNRLLRCVASPQWHNGQFHNPSPTFRTIQWSRMIDFFLRHRAGHRPSAPIAHEERHLASIQEGELVWLGHSGFYLRWGGLSIAIDPCLYDASPVPGFFRPFAGANIYEAGDLPALDVLLITHDHYDHLDYHVVSAIRDRVKRVICPLGVGAHFESWHYSPSVITELDWEDSTDLAPDLRLTALPSQHFSGRTFRRNRTLWASYLLEHAGFKLFFSGDSGYGSHFANIAQRHGPIDWAVMESGQYDDNWPMVHMRPQDWEKAVHDLAPRTIIPCHNSKYELSRHDWNEPLLRTSLIAAQLGIPYLTPVIGQVVRIGKPNPELKRWWPERP